MQRMFTVAFSIYVGTFGCKAQPAQSDGATRGAEPAAVATAPASGVSALVAPAAGSRVATAVIGQPAPDFTLSDLDGKTHQLSALRGKVVVLEWFNPECPFVRNSHTKGSLVGTADRHIATGVVWLAINSGAAGRQGAGVETNREGRARFGMKHPILLDAAGKVGRQYGARTTPHLFVIDARGVLIYKGAIDNSPDGEGEAPKGGKLINYVDEALAALATGRALAVAESEPYGCSVKYAQ